MTVEIMEISQAKQWRTIVSSENPELLKKAQEELKENPETRDQEIQNFRERVLAEEHLVSPVDDAFLLRFLRARKFDQDRALKMLRHYFSIRIKFPGIFASYRPSAISHALNENVQVILPHTDQLGRGIHVIRLGQWNPKNSSVDEHMALLQMCNELALSDEEIQIHGIVVVFDMTHLGMVHARQITPVTAKKITSLIQDCLPARFKGFHVLFESAIFDTIYQIVKPFLNKKTKSRVFLHGHDVQSLHKHIDPAILPQEFGGQLPAADYSLTAKILLDRDDEIAFAVAKYGYKKAKNSK